MYDRQSVGLRAYLFSSIHNHSCFRNQSEILDKITDNDDLTTLYLKT